jgi:F0F1-type ATP synthase delta subunit
VAPSSTHENTLQLPVSVVSRVDVGRLLREVEAIDSFLKQSAIREPGTQVKLPKTSRLFDEVVQVNKINVLHEDERVRLHHFLTEVRADAPTVHMSFSADPAPAFTQRLITWLRSEVHPVVLLQVGLQPNIGAGCVVRTTNKYFDFSLRSRLKEKGDVLAQLLKAGSSAKAAEAAPVEAPNG